MDTPRVLLEHYLKQLRLPTMVREFPKLAEQCAKEGATFEQFLLRLVEQEMLDRERRATERRSTALGPLTRAATARQLRAQLLGFMDECVYPAEPVFHEQLAALENRWAM